MEKGTTRPETDKTEVAALDKAIRVLEYLAKVDGDISLGKLAACLNIPKTTLLRLLTTLGSHGMVQQDPFTKNYRLGWALIYMGGAAAKLFDLSKIIRPYLERLSEETGESASLVRLRKNFAVYVDRVSSNSIIRGGLGVGAELQLHVSAAGKMLLSGLPDEAIRRQIGRQPLSRHTERTITDPERIFEEIVQARQRGYAMDDEEGELGARCVAAPITDWNGEVIAALSITGPISRMTTERMPQYIHTVCRIAKEASDKLKSYGGVGSLTTEVY